MGHWHPETGARALVFGDSQTEFVGEAVASRLRALGHSADVSVHKGHTSTRLVDDARAELGTSLGSADSYDLVYLFAGGNDARKTGQDFSSSVAELVQIFPTAPWWVGPAPQTRIGDMEYAASVWGSPPSSAEAFLGDKAQRREAYSAQLGPQVQAAGGRYLDLRHAGLGGTEQAPGVFFPDLADGVHVTGNTAEAAADWIVEQSAPGGSRAPVAMWIALGGGALALVALVAVVARRRRK